MLKNGFEQFTSKNASTAEIVYIHNKYREKYNTKPVLTNFDDDFMRETIRAIASKGHIQLQETFCDDIVSAMLAHPKVLAARVSTSKPDVYPDCHSVGVEVFRIKSS